MRVVPTVEPVRGKTGETAMPPLRRGKMRPSHHEGDYRRKRSPFWLFVTLFAIVAALLAGEAFYKVVTSVAEGHRAITLQTVMATERIPAGAPIVASMFKVIPVPTLYRPADAAGSAAQVEGRIADIDIPDGVVITIGALRNTGAPPTLAGELGKGNVGFFLPESILVEPLPLGLVNRGDHVDVYVAGLPAQSEVTDPSQPANPMISCVPILGWEDAGQPVPQNVINTSGSTTTSTAGFILLMSPQAVSHLLIFVQSGNKFGLVVDSYQACTGK